MKKWLPLSKLAAFELTPSKMFTPGNVKSRECCAVKLENERVKGNQVINLVERKIVVKNRPFFCLKRLILAFETP